jgi:hypothetical protein
MRRWTYFGSVWFSLPLSDRAADSAECDAYHDSFARAYDEWQRDHGHDGYEPYDTDPCVTSGRLGCPTRDYTPENRAERSWFFVYGTIMTGGWVRLHLAMLGLRQLGMAGLRGGFVLDFPSPRFFAKSGRSAQFPPGWLGLDHA